MLSQFVQQCCRSTPGAAVAAAFRPRDSTHAVYIECVLFKKTYKSRSLHIRNHRTAERSKRNIKRNNKSKH